MLASAICGPAVFLIAFTGCMSAPAKQQRVEEKEPVVPLRHIGSAVAPVVGAVVGPLLVNIANGITNGITTTITSGYEPLDYGHDPSPIGQYELYLVNIDDESQPYLLLDSVRPQYYGAASPHNHRQRSAETNHHATNKSSWEEEKIE